MFAGKLNSFSPSTLGAIVEEASHTVLVNSFRETKNFAKPTHQTLHLSLSW